MSNLRATIAVALITCNALIGCVPLYLIGALRPLLPAGIRHRAGPAMEGIVQLWVAGNQWIFRVLGIRVDTHWRNADDLTTRRWYLVIANHQSWADILILQNVFRGRIPLLKFFTKRELIWVPLIGLAMWFLGFPYVRRVSRERIAADPQLAALDRQSTLDACRRFRDHPTSVLGFLEGTRFTPAKHAAQDAARFDGLLNPKLGGASCVVASLSDRLHKVLDVTLVYPEKVPTFWELLQGRCPRVEVLVEGRELPADARASTDPDQAREALRPWIDTLWQQKDDRLKPIRQLAN